jgi:hypothetical protein
MKRPAPGFSLLASRSSQTIGRPRVALALANPVQKRVKTSQKVSCGYETEGGTVNAPGSVDLPFLIVIKRKGFHKAETRRRQNVLSGFVGWKRTVGSRCVTPLL